VARIRRLAQWAVPGALLALLAVPGAAAAAQLVHSWKADGDFTDTIAANDGSGIGDTTFAPGRMGQAFAFDGTGDYVSVPDAASHHFAGSFTIDAWVSTTSTGGAIATYYDCAQSCVSNPPSFYQIRVSGGKASGTVRDGAAFGNFPGQTMTGGRSVNDGSFHHVSLVRDVEVGMLSLYVDGLVAAEAPLEAQADGPITDGEGEPDPLTIGAQIEGGQSTLQPGTELNGLVDEVRLWSGANHPPRPSGDPTISGTAVAGQTLTCVSGDWTGSPTFSFAWLRDGAPIPDATAQTYTLTATDVGRQIACQVTAANEGGSPTVISGAVTPTAAPFPPGPLQLDDLPPLTDADVGRIAQVAPRSGVVLVSLNGVTFTLLSEAREIPVGSVLDTRRGTIRLRTATGSGSRTQTGDFGRGLFQLRQSRRKRARGLTDLVLKGGSFRGCAAGGGRGEAGAALSRRVIRSLRSNARGRFRTSGRNSSATVRGTIWTTADRCDGTLTTVKRGKVVVRDLRRKRTVVLSRGESYLARAPRASRR
jgi:hypothetical protein